MAADDVGVTPEASLREAVRSVHRSYPTVVTIVTATGASGPAGLTCSAFTSVSLDPPLVLVCINASSRTHDALALSDHVGISLLARDQAEVARVFATSGGDKFAGVAWESGPGTGVPLISGACAVMETVIENRVSAGTHTILVCRVVSARNLERDPLLYLDGTFLDQWDAGR